MPRLAWLAVGAAAGALGLDLAPGLVVSLVGLALGCGALAASGAAGHVAPGADWWRALAHRIGPLALGVLLVGLRGVGGQSAITGGPIPSGTGPWSGVVETVGSPRDGTRPATIRLDTTPPMLVAATLPWYPAVVPSDRVQIGGRIQAPRPGDDYSTYLARIGAIGTLRADSLSLLPALGTLAQTLEGFRRSAAGGLDRAMPEPEAGLAAGVLIGLRDRVDRDLASAFTTAGASHVVAISGWNIAIVASTLGALGGGMRRRRRAILTAIGIVVYVAFVGPSPSVVRAAAMAGVALLARELGRPGSAAGALGWACTVLLLLDPTWVDDAGFRLSVLATAGIIAWGSQLTARLAGAEPGRPRRWVADILGVSFAAQAATTPIVLLEFGRLSLVAPIVNLIVVPLVPAAMATGALAMAVGMLAGLGLPGVVATLVGLPAWVLYTAMVTTVRVGAGLPLASLTLPPPWDVVAAGCSFLLIAAAARWGDRAIAALRTKLPVRSGPTRTRAAAPRTIAVQSAGRIATPAAPRNRHGGARGHSRLPRLAALALAGATIGLALVVAHRPDGVTRIVVLDVGQGDGILVEGARGGRMVVDGGPDPTRMLIALDERLPPWDRRIDILVLTHPHEDHVAGLAVLLRRYRVGRVYEPGMIGPGPGYKAWADAFGAGGPPHGRLSTGDQLTLDTIHFRVLWPDANRVPLHPADGGTAINNVSIVLLGEVGSHRFLLAGDVEEGVDPELLARGLPQVDFLKVAHHGSKTASTRPFLEAVRPSVAVVSAGLGNPYGHPAPSTIERLHELAGKTYRTDTDGTVEVAFDGAAIRVRTSGPRPTLRPTPRPTTAAAAPPIPGVAVAGASIPAGLPPAGQLLCGIPSNSNAAVVGVIRPPVGPMAPLPPSVALGGPAVRRSMSIAEAALPHLPELVIGRASTLGYHRPDGDLPGIGDRAAPRDRSPRLLLGRRRVRSRRCARRIPSRSTSISRWPARALATRDGSRRSRPPPR